MSKSSSMHRRYQRLLREKNKISRVEISTIPHHHQPYPTVGDWRFKEDGTLTINVSNMSDGRYEMLVAVHELVEALLCRHRGITTEAVDEFDKAFEASRLPGDESEPGDHVDAPYRREHFFATNIERLLAAELGVDWATYDKEVNDL